MFHFVRSLVTNVGTFLFKLVNPSLVVNINIVDVLFFIQLTSYQVNEAVVVILARICYIEAIKYHTYFCRVLFL